MLQDTNVTTYAILQLAPVSPTLDKCLLEKLFTKIFREDLQKKFLLAKFGCCVLFI